MILATPEQYHNKNHSDGRYKFESCWRCARARFHCLSKIKFSSWLEAEEWVQEFNESRSYKDCVTRYRCRWCMHWHMAKADDKRSMKRTEKKRRKWLIQNRIEVNSAT